MNELDDKQKSGLLLSRADITGVVLAGGRGRRMGRADKGLLLFRGKPLVCHALEVLNEIADTVFINANRNAEIYAALGYPVLPDPNGDFEGPLAGVLSAMRAAATPYVLTVPCDAPLLDANLLSRLVDTKMNRCAAVAVAHDGERLHPVVMLAESRLADDLEAYLAGGQRKVESWIRGLPWTPVDFSDRPGVFININTPEELDRLEGGDRNRAGEES
jgi:molybdopterin-guanine dinucleotide biosynthesis protein A